MSGTLLFNFIVLFISILLNSCSDGTSSNTVYSFMIPKIEGNDRGSLHFLSDNLDQDFFILHSDIDIVDLLWSNDDNLYGVTGINWSDGYQEFNQFDFKEKKINDIFSDDEIIGALLSNDNSKVVYYKNEINNWKYIVRNINSNEIVSFQRSHTDNVLLPICWNNENLIIFSDYYQSIYSYNLLSNNLDVILNIENSKSISTIASPDNSSLLITVDFQIGNKEKILFFDISSNDTTLIFEDTLDIGNARWFPDNNRIIFSTDLKSQHNSNHRKINILDINSSSLQSFKDSIQFYPITAHPNEYKFYGWAREFWGQIVLLDLDAFTYKTFDYTFINDGNPQKVPISNIKIELKI